MIPAIAPPRGMARKIQPIAFRGTREATSAPMVAKAKRARKSATPVVSFVFPAPCQPAVFIATMAAAIPRMKAQIPAAIQVVGRVHIWRLTR